MLDQIGMPYSEIEANGLFLPVLTVSAEYKSPARFDDHLEIHLFLKKKPRARMHFDYEVRRGEELLAIGQSSHGFMDRNGKGQRPPDDLIKLLEVAWINEE